MFEKEIKEESKTGILLHDRRGIEYWKLSLICTRKGCEKEVDMGECLCFDNEKEMTDCRDEHGLHCSTKCWYEDVPRDRIDKVVSKIKKHNENCEAAGDFGLILLGPELENIENYFESMADEYDGAEFYEQWDVDECPV